MNRSRDFILKSFLRLLFTLLGIFFLTFFVMSRVPGNPVLSRVERGMSQADYIKAVRESDLNHSSLEKLATYFYRVSHFDFGTSLVSGEKIGPELLIRLGNTFILALCASLVFLVLGFGSALLGILYRDGLVDYFLKFLTALFLSTPVFWFALVLIFVFSLKLALLPASGSSGILALILPALTVGLRPAAFFQRMLLQKLKEIYQKPFIQVARAKGLTETGVLIRHALKNAMIPAITIIGLEFGSLLTGAVVAETIFAYKGVGTYILQGIESRDYNIILATVLLSCFCVMVVNFLVDVLSFLIDPRLSGESH